MQPTFAGLSSQSELVITITKELVPIRRGAKITIVFCTLFLPTKLVEVFVVVVSFHVKELEKHVTPKLVPSPIPQIGVGVEITLIQTITHASKQFKILNTMLKDTPMSEKLKLELVPLVEPINTTGEKPIDDLTTNVVFND